MQTDNSKTVTLGGTFYKSATTPNFFDQSYFVLIPSHPPRVDIIMGNSPSGLGGYIQPNTAALRCVESNGIVCVRADHVVDVANVHSEIFLQWPNFQCQMGAKWKGLKALTMSNDGQMVAFSAVENNKNKIFIGAVNRTCTVLSIDR